MKKEYVKPTVVVEEFMAELAFLGGSQTEGGDGSNVGGGAQGGVPAGSNEHRGGWGDLWN